MAVKTLVITNPTGATGGATGTYISVPNDFVSLISIEAIAGGGGGSASIGGVSGNNGSRGGGGGAYVKSTGATGLVAGATMFYYIGYGGLGGSTGPSTNGGPTWLTIGVNAIPAASYQGIFAPGGIAGASGASGGFGGGASGTTGAINWTGSTGYRGGKGG